MIAETMYAKGQAFVIAAALLRQNGGYEYAVLHLLCQGIEVALKGILLAVNYDQFKPQLKPIGHNLVRLADVAMSATNLQPMKPALRADLEVVSNLYSRHLLRYGSTYDLYVSASSMQSQRLFRRVASAFRLVRMKGSLRDPIA